MHLSSRLLVLCAAALAPVLHAGSFEQAVDYLDLDGELVGFVDFDGDGAIIGERLNEIYQDFLAQNPQAIPVPVDFIALFETLGFGSIQSVAASGKRLEEGFYRNRVVYLLDGPPSGLVALYGGAGDTIAGFPAAKDAPADALSAISGTLNLSVVREIVVSIMNQVMGPMGAAIVDQQTGQLLPGTDISYDELIGALGGRIDAAWKQEWNPDMSQTVAARVRFHDAGALLDRLRPLSAMVPVVFEEGDTGLTADFSALVQGAGTGLFLHAPAEGGDLLVYTDPEWIAGDGGSLADTDDFKRYAGELPDEAIFYSYSSGIDVDSILASLAQVPGAEDYIPLSRKVIDLFFGGFLEPNANAITVDDDAMVSVQYAGFSTKHAVIAFPAAFGGGLMAAMAVPAFEKVRQTSQEKTVINNLRMIASAADQYFLETGESEVTFEQLVGPDAYIREIEPVAGEVYEGMVITIGMPELGVLLEDGRVVSIPF